MPEQAVDDRTRVAPFVFFVPGVPAPAGSKKAFPFKKKNGRLGVAVTDASSRSRPWKDRISAIAAEQWKWSPLECPIILQLAFNMPRPKGHYGSRKGEAYLKEGSPHWHTGTPDTTKLIRAVEDALTGIVWKDDALIAYQVAAKTYGERNGVTIIVTPMIGDQIKFNLAEKTLGQAPPQ